MTFPLASKKTDTLYVNQDSDAIWQARASIENDIENVNNIIDTFDIASPTDYGILGYDSSTSKFKTLFPAIDLQSVYLTFNDFTRTGTDPSNLVYNDDGLSFATIMNPNHQTGITISNPDSAGQYIMSFPAGNYYFQQVPFAVQKNSSITSANFYWVQIGTDSAGWPNERDDTYTDIDRTQMRSSQILTSRQGGTDYNWITYEGNNVFNDSSTFDSAGEATNVKNTNRDLFQFDVDTELVLRYEITTGFSTQQEHPDIIIRRLR